MYFYSSNISYYPERDMYLCICDKKVAYGFLEF